jgi:hypothetical protein
LATVGLVISQIVDLIVKNTVPLFAQLDVLLFGLAWDVICQLTAYNTRNSRLAAFPVAFIQFFSAKSGIGVLTCAVIFLHRA